MDKTTKAGIRLNCTKLHVGLVSLLNGISTLFRSFNAEAILLEEQ